MKMIIFMGLDIMYELICEENVLMFQVDEPVRWDFTATAKLFNGQLCFRWGGWCRAENDEACQNKTDIFKLHISFSLTSVRLFAQSTKHTHTHTHTHMHVYIQAYTLTHMCNHTLGLLFILIHACTDEHTHTHTHTYTYTTQPPWSSRPGVRNLFEGRAIKAKYF